MTIALVIWILFIAGEVYYNFLIIKREHPVDHLSQTFVRVVCGLALWLGTAVFADIDLDSWIPMPVMMALTFWFLFDSGLSWFITKPHSLIFLGTTAKLDRLQRKAPLLIVWFAKFLLAAGSVMVFGYGFNAIGGH